MPFPLIPHRSPTLPAVSFFEGFQTSAGLRRTGARTCGRHLKPITIPEIKAEETSARITSDSGTCLLLTTIFALVCPAPSIATICLGHSGVSAKHCRLLRRGLHAAPCEGRASHARPIALRSSAHVALYEGGTLLYVVQPE